MSGRYDSRDRGRGGRSGGRGGGDRGGGGRGGGERGGGERGHQGRMMGTVVAWQDEKGFGFIKPSNGGEDVFAHASNFNDGDCLKEGSEVEFEEKYDDRKGKYRAMDVTGCRLRGDLFPSGRGGGRGRDSRGRGGGRDDKRGRSRSGGRRNDSRGRR